MAGSGSYARGDQPRSVPDELDGPYRAMAAKQRAYNERQEAAAQAATAAPRDDYWSSHPGVVESLVPVWGSAREAVADYRDGDMVGAAVNGALAVADLTGEGYVLKGVARGGLKTGAHAWGATRKWMGKQGLLEANQHGHHWLIPQKGWGKYIPDAIKNQPWNIKAMPTAETHIRMTGATKSGKPRFNAVERYVYGTPTWWKVQNGIWAGHAVQGAEEGLNPGARDDRAARSR